jgi:hypothetical protein
MTVKSPAESALFNPRALIGLGFSAVGLLLALLGFLAFPSSSALASPQCSEVEFNVYEESYGDMYVEMTSDAGCTIFATVGVYGYPSDPTHSGGTPTGSTFIVTHDLPVPLHQKRYIKALAYQPSPYVDSAITWVEADNTQL